MNVFKPVGGRHVVHSQRDSARCNLVHCTMYMMHCTTLLKPKSAYQDFVWCSNFPRLNKRLCPWLQLLVVLVCDQSCNIVYSCWMPSTHSFFSFIQPRLPFPYLVKALKSNWLNSIFPLTNKATFFSYSNSSAGLQCLTIVYSNRSPVFLLDSLISE